jgi:hypothetical protein
VGSKNWSFGGNGTLTAAGSVRLAPGGRFITDGSDGVTTAAKWLNYPDTTSSYFIRLYSDEDTNERGRLGLGNLSAITITTTSNANGIQSGPLDYKWSFGGDGTLTNPVFAVADLPAPVAGMRAFVSDAAGPDGGSSAPTYGLGVTSGTAGDSFTAPVWSDGTAWYIG